jgi:3-(3-hydroxy-phenyl)propionate hydroxylase
MAEHEVLIAGAGPTGLMLAAELKLAGVDVAIVERRATPELAGTRAGGLHARSLEVLDQRGIADRFIAAGKTMPFVFFHMMQLDISDFPSRHNCILALTQNHIERLLAEWAGELQVPILREHEVTFFAQRDSHVEVAFAGGETIRAQYLVGCDGGRSVVRKLAGIDFPGSDATMSWMIAEVEMRDEPKSGFHTDALGTHAMGRMENGHTVRLVLVEPASDAAGDPTISDLSALLTRIYGTDFGVHSPTWISRFSDATRQAAAYRHGRVLLAGDAAHIHPPMGGQGLNIGMQDAVNLGWKLAQVVKSISPDTLLDTYHAERHPVGARVLQNTMAQSVLRQPDARSKALAETVTEFLKLSEPRKQLVGELSGLGVHYDLGVGHPLVGRRMPDLDLITTEGTVRAFSLLRGARGVMIDFVGGGAIDLGPWRDRVTFVDAKYDSPWELPVIGAVAAPGAVLVRPDGYVAWVGKGSEAGLCEALSNWFGDGAIN